MIRRAAALLLMFAVAGCALAPSAGERRATVARQIADDAVAFNEAYGQAVSGQILLNILRGRDRLPRYYLSMTGIADSPSLRYRQNAGAGGIPLGEGASPWGIGNFGVERETQSRPTYAVQPFTAETLTRTAFEPTAPQVFEHYWRSGWPRDILLLLMVERIDKVDAEGVTHSYVNEANEIFEDCAPQVETGGCDFVRELRDFLVTVSEPPPGDGIDLRHGRPLCGVIDVYGPTTPVRPVPPQEGRRCDPVFAIGATQVTLRLRSLDDMIYYVGELLRIGSMTSGDGPIDAPLTVRAAGLRGGGAGVPLFRISPADVAPGAIYAAAATYGGERYVAGPAIGRSCGEASLEGRCRDDADNGDRSSSVLSLMAELMALNQSPDAIRAPSRLIAE